jgi:DNA-binding NarL/FixJ family response regulator
MNERHRILIVGDSLFAETLAQLLTGSGIAEVAGVVPTLDQALSWLQTATPDVVIVASPETGGAAIVNPLLAAHPDLSIIRADLSEDYVQMITSQRISAHRAGLLAAIQALPKRR